MRPLVLVGGGGHCKSVINVAVSVGRTIMGILDLPENKGKSIINYPILGGDEDIPLYVDKADFIVTVGFIKDSTLRINIHDKIISAGGRLGVLIASSAHVSPFASIGEGTVIMHQAVVNADAQVGIGCIINTLCDIEHDASIGNYCHISTGAMVNGNCCIGDSSFIGSQSVIVNGISVVGNSIVAAGSVVRKNIIRPGLYAGNPAVLYKV